MVLSSSQRFLQNLFRQPASGLASAFGGAFQRRFCVVSCLLRSAFRVPRSCGSRRAPKTVAKSGQIRPKVAIRRRFNCPFQPIRWVRSFFRGNHVVTIAGFATAWCRIQPKVCRRHPALKAIRDHLCFLGTLGEPGFPIAGRFSENLPVMRTKTAPPPSVRIRSSCKTPWPKTPAGFPKAVKTRPAAPGPLPARRTRSRLTTEEFQIQVTLGNRK